MDRLIKNLERFQQPLTTEGIDGIESLTGAYEIGNKHLLLMEVVSAGESLKESKYKSLKNISDAWNMGNNKNSLLIVVEANTDEQLVYLKDCYIKLIYKDNKETEINNPLPFIEYLRTYIKKHNITKLKNL